MSTRQTRKLISSVILLLAVLVFIGSCATTKKAISDEDFFEAFSGTWINIDIDTFQKQINYPDGTWEIYGKVTYTIPIFKGKVIILEKWIDSKGNIWYKSHLESQHWRKNEGFQMGKISNSGNTLEYIRSHGANSIEEWEPDNLLYDHFIYHRQ